MKVAVYVRVSTKRQTNLNQFIQLRKEAERRGWKIAFVFRDMKSGKNTKRPGFQKMLAAARMGRFDVLMSYSPSRLGRNFAEQVATVSGLGDIGVDLYTLSPNVDTTTKMGRAFFYISSIWAEVEREDLIERVHTGIERARKQGKNIGRPRSCDDFLPAVLELRSKGYGIGKIATELRLGTGTVHRMVREHRV